MGTGVLGYSILGHNLLGPNIPPILTKYLILNQFNLFGGYPAPSDVVPSSIFLGVFSLIFFLHLTIFLINVSRNHYFWISLGWLFYAIMRVIAWALRITWSKDLSNARMGITSEVFLILPSIVLVSLNLVLAARIFAWRHPVGGSRRLFWNTMLTLYAVVLGVIGMTIFCAAIRYAYPLSLKSYVSYQKGVQASSILIILYSLTAVALLVLAYFFPTTRKDDNLYTYQPWWIESFSPFYFVSKGAKKEAEESFMKRVSNHRHAVRVIAATHHHYNMVQGLTTQRGSLKHNVSLMIIVTTTVLIFVGAILRSIVLFQARPAKDASLIGSPVAMYIVWGLFEVFINFLYIVGRVDLRFYRPDRLPKKVRNIITAEQSINNTPDSLSLASSNSSITDSEKPTGRSTAAYLSSNDDDLSSISEFVSEFVFDDQSKGSDYNSPPYPLEDFKF
jgi:uncharacterized membrane protein